MIKLALIIALMGTAFAVSSEVAFTSYNTMASSEYEVLSHVVVKNTEPTETTKDCLYIKEFKTRYNFTTSKEHEYIYYYVWQCLKESQGQPLRSTVTFNYDGDDSNMHELPEGCIPPSPESPPDNPCENGYALGEQIADDVTTMTTKKLVDHPENNEVPEDLLTVLKPEELDEVTKKFPALEETLEKLIEENHASEPEHRKPDEVKENPDGTVTEVYKFSNGDVAEKTVTEDETVTVVTTPDNTTITETDRPNQPTHVEKRDPEGVLVEKRIIEVNPEDPTEEIVKVYNPPNTSEPKKHTRPRPRDDKPLNHVNIPDDVQEEFDNVAVGFAAALENYVEESVKCFAEQVINVKDSYLTFVCSTTGHSSIKDLLEEKFAGQMLCDKMDCDGIQSELMEKMTEHAQATGTSDSPSVTRKVSTEISRS